MTHAPFSSRNLISTPLRFNEKNPKLQANNRFTFLLFLYKIRTDLIKLDVDLI